MSRCVAVRYSNIFASARQSFRGDLSWAREGFPLLSSGIAMAVLKKSTAKEAGQEKESGSPPEFTRAQELSALRDMLLIRRFEEKAGQLYGMGAIGGFCHLYICPENPVVRLQIALKPGAPVLTGYRRHGPKPAHRM